MQSRQQRMGALFVGMRGAFVATMQMKAVVFMSILSALLAASHAGASPAAAQKGTARRAQSGIEKGQGTLGAVRAAYKSQPKQVLWRARAKQVGLGQAGTTWQATTAGQNTVLYQANATVVVDGASNIVTIDENNPAMGHQPGKVSTSFEYRSHNGEKTVTTSTERRRAGRLVRRRIQQYQDGSPREVVEFQTKFRGGVTYTSQQGSFGDSNDQFKLAFADGAVEVADNGNSGLIYSSLPANSASFARLERYAARLPKALLDKPLHIVQRGPGAISTTTEVTLSSAASAKQNARTLADALK